jgi:hypothetical protein
MHILQAVYQMQLGGRAGLGHCLTVLHHHLLLLLLLLLIIKVCPLHWRWGLL